MTTTPSQSSRVAVVTGGGSGFGRALAEHCALAGFDLFLLDIDGDRVAQAADDLAERHGVRAHSTPVDVSDAAAVDAGARLVESTFGRCDLLFVNVGVQLFGAVERLTDEEWRWVLDVNVIGAVRTVRSMLPLLRRTEGSRIVFTCSANALAPAARLGAYQASKYALLGVADTLRIELADEGIGVSVVFPLGMLTRHLESSAAARPDELGEIAPVDEDLTAMMASRPLGEKDITTAEDAARRVLGEVLAGEAYILTHGDLSEPVAERDALVQRALERLAADSAAQA